MNCKANSDDNRPQKFAISRKRALIPELQCENRAPKFKGFSGIQDVQVKQAERGRIERAELWQYEVTCTEPYPPGGAEVQQDFSREVRKPHSYTTHGIWIACFLVKWTISFDVKPSAMRGQFWLQDAHLVVTLASNQDSLEGFLNPTFCVHNWSRAELYWRKVSSEGQYLNIQGS